jgi:inulosucrase
VAADSSSRAVPRVRSGVGSLSASADSRSADTNADPKAAAAADTGLAVPEKQGTIQPIATAATPAVSDVARVASEDTAVIPSAEKRPKSAGSSASAPAAPVAPTAPTALTAPKADAVPVAPGSPAASARSGKLQKAILPNVDAGRSAVEDLALPVHPNAAVAGLPSRPDFGT